MSSSRLILLTPFFGDIKNLEQTFHSLIEQLDNDDIWIIVLDNQNIKEYEHIKNKYKQIIFLKNSGPRGAGNSRNIGLDYLSENITGEFLLLPFDGDDRIQKDGIKLLKYKLRHNPFSIVSFSHCKIWPSGETREIKYSGIYNLNDLLKRYNTPCGSTVIKIKNSKILKNLRFGSRKRANDALFFYQVVRYFGKYQCYPEIFLQYKIGNNKSLSGKKYKMIYYRYLALRDFKLGYFKCLYYIFYYIVTGIRRYVLKHSI